jgi:hypothetical protein
MKFKYLFFILFLIPLVSLNSQVIKYSNEFLTVGIGARSLAMGNASVASCEDVTAGYWNPAGLANLSTNYDLSAMHAEYFAGIAKFDYIGYAQKLDDKSSIGLSIIRFGIDDIPNTLDLIDGDGNINYDNITTFSAADYAFLFSYARKSPVNGLLYGGNVKIIHRIIGSFASAWGFGFDLSAKYDVSDWKFGAVARDVTSTFNAWTFDNSSEMKTVFEATGNDIPQNSLEITMPRLLIGAARNIRISQKFNLMPELDADFTFDGQQHTLVSFNPISIDPHFGFELDYLKLVYFRGGIRNIQNIPDLGSKTSLTFMPNLGLGIHFKNISLDYALTDIGDESIALYSNIFSLRYTFNVKRENGQVQNGSF